MSESLEKQARAFWEKKGYEYVPCPLCGAAPDKARTMFLVRDTKYNMPGVFRFARCGSCGLTILNPRPRRIADLYDVPGLDYYTDATQGHSFARARIVERFRNSGARLLDVGPGGGGFLSHMKAQGWDVTGVEMEAAAARSLGERLGVAVHPGTLEAAIASGDLAPGSFDVITFWDVIEHLPTPVDTLAAARSHLAPGGHVVLSTPNANSPEARAFGPRWYSLEVPRHLCLFSPRTLRELARRSGLCVHSQWCATTATGVLRSLKPEKHVATRENHGAQPKPNRAAGSFIKKLLFNAALVPALRACDAAGMGGHMIAVLHDPGA